MSSISSEEVNYLIYRYLQEAGFVHAAFAFSQESFISKADIKASAVPPGMLVTLLQKGLHYAAIEFHLNDDGTEKRCSKAYSLLEPHTCERPTAATSGGTATSTTQEGMTTGGRPSVGKREASAGRLDKSNSSLTGTGSTSGLNAATLLKGEGGASGGGRRAEGNLKRRKKENTANETAATKTLTAANLNATVTAGKTGRSTLEDDSSRRQASSTGMGSKESKRRTTTMPTSTAVMTAATVAGSTMTIGASMISPLSSLLPSSPSFAPQEVSILLGHESEVITCAWNPISTQPMLASASGDGTARLWRVPQRGPLDVQKARLSAHVLEHLIDVADAESKDVTTIDWSPNGRFLATGCYDGKARLWRAEGELVAVLAKHAGPIFQLQWSPDGRMLVSAGVEPSVAVWDVQAQSLYRSCEHHSAPALDVDWRDNHVFATCSTDKLVYVYDVGRVDPVLTLAGHQDEVNSVKWSPDGTLIISSSDDTTAKIWRISPDLSEGLLHCTLAEHTMEIYTAKWSPDVSLRIVATASFDGTVRLWDANDGTCRHVLRQHSQPVYAIAFSPCGRFLASGSLDGALHVWSVEEGRLLRSYRGNCGGVFEVAWSRTGERIAAATSEAALCILDFAEGAGTRRGEGKEQEEEEEEEGEKNEERERNEENDKVEIKKEKDQNVSMMGERSNGRERGNENANGDKIKVQERDEFTRRSGEEGVEKGREGGEEEGEGRREEEARVQGEA